MIYLDHHSTTPCDPRVVEAMLPWFSEHFGNAASVQHAAGTRAADAVERARETIASAIGAEPREIVFTSGATESNNLAIKGFAAAAGPGHAVATLIEHRSVLDPLGRMGAEVSLVAPRRDGLVDPAAFAAAMRDDTRFAAMMLANNEVGTIQPVAEAGALCAERGILLHCDAVQAFGRIPIDVRTLGAGTLAVSAHKLHGPKGVGALYVRSRPRVKLAAQIDGGRHERGLRSGTLNVPGIVGFGRAVEIAVSGMRAEAARLSGLRDELRARLVAAIPGVRENGDSARKLPHSLSLTIPGVQASALLMALGDRVAFSSGSACSSADPEPSHVLLAMGMPEEEAACTIRLAVGRTNTEGDVQKAASLIAAEAMRLRSIA